MSTELGCGSIAFKSDAQLTAAAHHLVEDLHRTLATGAAHGVPTADHNPADAPSLIKPNPQARLL